MLIIGTFSSPDVVGRFYLIIVENKLNDFNRHIHVSLWNKSGKNSFALSDYELKSGRSSAAYDDTKFITQEAEWFLAGVLDGIADGTRFHVTALFTNSKSFI
jgi:hypothetical protein